MKRGTIVLTQFPFTDLTSTKRRPALIVSRELSSKRDVIVAFISSVIPDQITDTDLLITSDDSHFKMTGLKRNSVIKLNKLCTINTSAFSGELGEIHNEKLLAVNDKLKIALDLS